MSWRAASLLLLLLASPASSEEEAMEAEAFRVVGRKEELSRSGIAGPRLRKVAGAGGDALRAVQTLPGVAALSDFSGQMAVRGGGPEDNKTYLDGIPWPVPYHFVGVLTTVHSDLLDGVDLYAGGFPARLGNADGAVIEARTRPGQRTGFKAQADVNLVTASLLTEGPLGLPYGPSSWTAYARRSYFDLVLPKLMTLDFAALPSFSDLGGTLDWEPAAGRRLRLLSLSTDDVLGLTLGKEQAPDPDFQGALRYRNRYWTTGLAWEEKAGPLKSTAAFYYYQVDFENSFGKGYYISSQPRVWGLKEELEWRAGGGHTLGLGGGMEWVGQNVSGFTFRRAKGAGSGYTVVSDPSGVTVSSETRQGHAYLQDAWEFMEGAVLTAGARFDRGGMSAQALAPRLGLEWRLGDYSVRAAWGIYAQLPTARELNPDFGNPSLGSNLTEHVVAGVERPIARHWNLRLEGYSKTYRNRVIEVPDARLFSNEGEGQAAGAELFLRYDSGERLFGWLSYSYSQSRRKEGPHAPWRPYRYDQPHVATLVANWKPYPAFELGGTFRYHSGALVTPIAGSFYDSSKDLYQPIYSDPYSDRLGDYHRLDMRTSYTWDFARWDLSLYLEVINVTDHANPAGRDYTRTFSSYKEVNQLPRLPYIGMTAQF